ncbi:hypothetical protein ACFOY4_40860 [Actinomadura syzygii]|uniref:Uncharacterized protein n=1 Tax=Actinomadura syzygii TaxID=1427538 RepID=A0A5D0UAK3_9ACTN|nr:hypothetical protein [Actinomadura syzygii]TYC14685.1 hypothetical protein FXF65_17840 [Actinomadura syzygii]
MDTRIIPEDLIFGERSVSWERVWERLFPEESIDEPIGDDYGFATKMNRMRGLIMTQCAELEAVLGLIVRNLESKICANKQTAGQLLNIVKTKLSPAEVTKWTSSLELIREAIRLRNRAVMHGSRSVTPI